MKQRKHAALALFCSLAAILVLLNACGSGLRYSRGKDSHAALGDGEYQLLRGGDGELDLMNCDTHSGVLYHVRSYKTIGNQVCFYGKTPTDYRSDYDMFLILELETNAVQMIIDDASVPAEEIEDTKRCISICFPEKPITILLLSEISSEERSILLSLSQE